MSEPAELSDAPGLAEAPTVVRLDQVIDDPELVQEITAHAEGRARDDFVRTALRIGVLALKQAQGRIDADAVRRESEHLMSVLDVKLAEHTQRTADNMAGTLKEYFDPESGRFSERVRRLVDDQDGELVRLIRAQIGSDDSALVRTLATHLGEHSPLMERLSPDDSKGIVKALSETTAGALEQQRERILREFSLDNREGALARLVAELTERHGQLEKALQGSIDAVVKEFSLDAEDSALSRLVDRVDKAQRQISSEFSLDEEQSALARMKRELLDVLAKHKESADTFREEVKIALREMQARKAEADKSTRHGLEFEAALATFVEEQAQQAGDIAERTGNTTGLIKNCKVGDIVVTLSPDSKAAGARIAIEAKEKEGYDLAKALDELQTARKNRDAGAGVFVFSRRTAPAGLEPLARYGTDVVTLWDAEDPDSDVFLRAALTVAKALSVRASADREDRTVDLEALERAIRDIEKQASGLDEIKTSATTIQSGSNKILERVRKMQNVFEKQISVVNEQLATLKAVLGAPGSAADGDDA